MDEWINLLDLVDNWKCVHGLSIFDTLFVSHLLIGLPIYHFPKASSQVSSHFLAEIYAHLTATTVYTSLKVRQNIMWMLES
jgi:hypothetical protein